MPFVSVIVPVRNEAGFIGGCLAALAAQDYPRDRFELIVVDGDSTDATRAEVEAAGLSDRVLTNPRRTTATGLNLGIAEARGEIIVRVDGHTRVQPDFIAANVRALQESGADCVGGPIETRTSGGAVGQAIALAMSSPFGVGDAAFRHSEAEQWTDSVPFAAYRREVFERIGRFAEDIDRGEDDEFNYRLRQAGGRILLTPAIRTVYYARPGYGGLVRQYWGYGLAKAAVLQRHPSRLRPRHLVPSAFVLTLAGGVLLSRLDRRFGLIAGLAAGAYSIANATATARIAAKGEARAAPFLPIAFACIHLAAGAGFIAGWLKALLPKARR